VKVSYEPVLEFLMMGLETFSRRDCGLILAGYRQIRSEAAIDRALYRLHRQNLVQRKGHGQSAKFVVTEQAKRRVRVIDPTRDWDRTWDGKWRVFSFDIPTIQRRERMLLWRSLRAQRFGLLQRSVWVWPHEVEPILLQIVKARGIPECFCGFESGRLFLCNDTEVVASAWDFDEIRRRHDSYLKHLVATVDSLDRADDLRALGRLARIERDAYQFAFSIDPMLPRDLWPKPYKGVAVHERHQTFGSQLRRRLRALAT
jgi:DNA-binding transcriptional regulator PaaX